MNKPRDKFGGFTRCTKVHAYGECDCWFGGNQNRIDVTEEERERMQDERRVTKDEWIKAIIAEECSRGGWKRGPGGALRNTRNEN